MKKVVLVYGIIAGVIVGGLIQLSVPLWNRGVVNFDNGHLVGYTTMVIAFSVIFFGVKSYRDNHGRGTITFWKAAQIGILITLVASVIYCLAWEVALGNMSADFITEMSENYRQQKISDGATAEELAEFDGLMQLYRENVMVRFVFTMIEPLPVGVILTLISAGLLRKKDFLPATATT